MKIQKEMVKRHKTWKRTRREKITERGKWRASDEKRKKGYKKVSLMLGHVSGEKRTPVRNYEQDTDQPQCLNRTCINMLSVGVCESISVHTVHVQQEVKVTVCVSP